MKDTFDPYAHFAHEGDYPDLDYAAAARRLAAALALPTVHRGDQTDFGPFDALRELVVTSYPLVMEHGTLELMGRSILVTVEGTSPDEPGVLLLAHQDVVPVAPGTEGDWEHGAFDGFSDDEWVWGRGALDIKDMLVGELEAVEYLLARHGRPRRTIWLAFGEDEETSSAGATRIAAALEERGARAAFSLDEGVTTFFDGAAYGAPGRVLSDICVSQKGYLNLRVSARGHGGHSSNPFGGTSLEHVCRAVAAICEARRPPELIPIVADTFRQLAPLIEEGPFLSLVSDVDANSSAIAEAASAVRELSPLVENTVSVNMVEGGSPAANVMPGDVSVVLNLRLLPGTTADDVLAWARSAVRGLDVTVEVVASTPAGRMDSTAGAGYEDLRHVLERYYPEVTFVPSIVCGGTDSVRYEAVCDSLLRVCPFRPAPEEEARGVHGTNERISRRVFSQGIRVMVALLERTAL